MCKDNIFPEKNNGFQALSGADFLPWSYSAAEKNDYFCDHKIESTMIRQYAGLVKFAHTIFAMPFALVGFVYALRTEGISSDCSGRYGWVVLLLQVLLCMVFARNAAMGFNRWADRRIDKAQKNAKGGDKRFNHEVEVFTALRDYMNEGNLARTFECSEDDAAMIATSDLLTLRKTIYAANLSETDVNAPESCSYFTQVQALAAKEGSEVLPICAKLEADIAELDDPDEKAMFMEELGLQQSGLDRLIQCSYELLGLISFLTDGKKECRAWTIRKGTKAPQAAGKIHSDFERGFIRASVIGYNDLEANNFDYAAVKAKGLQRTEGKEYVVKDGDVIEFLFNV